MNKNKNPRHSGVWIILLFFMLVSPFSVIQVAGQNLGFDDEHQVPELATKDLVSREFQAVTIQPSSGNEVSPGSQKIKIITDHDGIYQVTTADLSALGLADLPLAMFNLTSQGQAIAYHIQNDNGNSVFDANEAIVFWGTRFHGDYLASVYENENQQWSTFTRQLSDGSFDTWKPAFNKTMLEKYTNQNVYWLSWSGEPGIRMQSVDGAPINTTPEEFYRKTTRAEENRVWRTFPFTSEETWFWERIQGDTEQTRSYPILLEHPENSTNQAILRGSILAVKSFESAGPDHHVRIYINNQETIVAEIKWDGKSRIQFELPFPMSYLSPGNNSIRLVVVPTVTVPQVDLFIDWFEIEYDCDYRVSEDRIQIQTIGGTNREFLVRDFSNPDLLVMDVQNERAPVIVSGWQTQAGTSPDLVNVRFRGSSSNYYISPQSAIGKPVDISLFTSPNYLDEMGVDYAFITSHNLMPATIQYAAYRESSGYHTGVVDFQDLVNDFNFGIYHPIAIKNYFRYLLEKQGHLPTYALLVGDGHWNFQHSSNYSTVEIQIPPNLAWVDPWQGEVDSANLLATITGDDPVADLMIARLPVNTESEVMEYLDKVKTFDQSKPGNWHNNHLFVTDNPDDAGNFYNYANQVISTYIDPEPGMVSVRIFLENDPINTNQAIIDFLNKTGAQIVNYIGHGRINGWAAETILENSDIDRMNNPKTPPIFISMTCLDGYWIHPNQPSLIEELVRSKYGAVAAFSPTGLGVSTGHDIMHQAMYRAILHDRVATLGEAAEAAKLALFQANSDRDLLQTYTVFGDPSLRFRFDWKIYIPGIFKGN